MNWLFELKKRLNKNNNYWFRYRSGLLSADMGYGFVPISWQGWVFIFVFIGMIFSYLWVFNIFNTESNIVTYLITLFVTILIVSLFSWFKCRPKKVGDEK
jgi:uncharacterized membrane protein HdeD (DUF308 family)